MDRNTIADLNRLKAAKAAFKLRKKQWEDACRKLREEMGVNDLSINVGSIEVEITEKHNLLDKFRGTWDCEKSPLGVCFYEPDDGAMDFCIYCGDPDERK